MSIAALADSSLLEEVAVIHLHADSPSFSIFIFKCEHVMLMLIGPSNEITSEPLFLPLS